MFWASVVLIVWYSVCFLCKGINKWNSSSTFLYFSPHMLSSITSVLSLKPTSPCHQMTRRQPPTFTMNNGNVMYTVRYTAYCGAAGVMQARLYVLTKEEKTTLHVLAADRTVLSHLSQTGCRWLRWVSWVRHCQCFEGCVKDHQQRTSPLWPSSLVLEGSSKPTLNSHMPGKSAVAGAT